MDRTSMLRRNLDALAGAEFDVLVAGGGISGAVAAWDAALRGLRVALVERADLGSGASANSLKLLHGGLRYVRRFELRAAREAIRERRAWLRIAPHLVAPVPVLVPAYLRSIQNRLALRALLAASDGLAGDRNRRLAHEQHVPAGRMLSQGDVLERVPSLAGTAITGGALFHDARLHSSERLLFDVLRAASAAGAVVANYVELESGILRDGRVHGVWLRDRIGNALLEVRARAVVNATGSACSDVMHRLLGHLPARAPRPSLAFNVMVPARGLDIVLALAARPDGGWSMGRQLLRVPWRDREVLGTAHVPVRDPAKPLHVHEADLAAFLAQHDAACPGARTRLEDVVLVQAGLLPLEAATPEQAVRLQRRHRVIDHRTDGAAGAFTVVSVKYTTARLAAQHAIDAVVRHMGRAVEPCRTADTTLSSAGPPLQTLVRAGHERYRDVPPDVLEHLVRSYGTRFERILSYRTEQPDAGARVHAHGPVIVAELVHGVRDEMAQCAADLIWRRTELGARGLDDAAVTARTGALAEALLGAGVHDVPAETAPPLRPATAMHS
jgi:glycerol-3-phosphate dehydrogenase